MTSSCPPQLHLELPPNTTSFKRSFDQFGFDLESPLGAADGAVGSSTGDGNDRNKRARSASSFSDDDRSVGSSSSSTLASNSSPLTSDSAHGPSIGSHLAPAPRLGVPHLPLNIGRSSMEPPRLPTPEIQDIDMADYPLPGAGETETQDSVPQTGPSTESSVSRAEESYRLSLERFNAFDTQISALRRSVSPDIRRSPTPPPVLPPLELFGEEAPINTNTVSFLHPPAQPSPPLPHSLYNYGPPRNQPSGSRAAIRVESSLEDPRRLPHETHTRTQQIAEGSVSRDEGNMENSWPWDQLGPNNDDVYHVSSSWSSWAPVPAEAGTDGDDDEEEEVQEALEQPGSDSIWSSPIPPTLGLLRSPSPLFDHLDDINTRNPSPPPPMRANEHTAPPTLPPIEEQVLSHPWDPMEEVINTVFSRDEQRGEPLPSSQLSMPGSFPRLREHSPSDDDGSANATTGSEGVPALPSPRTDMEEWIDPWFIRSPEDVSGPSTSTMGPRNTAFNTSNPTVNNASSSNATPSTRSSNSNPHHRLALRGIGSAMDGLGQGLESEILGSYLRDDSNSNSNNENGITDVTNVVSEVAEGGSSGAQSNSTTTWSPSSRSSTEGRASAWRSTSSTGGEGSRGRETPAQRLMSLNAPTLSPPLLDDLDVHWPMTAEPSSMSRSAAEDDDIRSMLARYSGSRRASSPGSLVESLRTRAAALRARMQDTTEQLFSEENRDVQMQVERGRSPSPVPSMRTSPWGGHSGVRRDRDRELPTNASMLFRDRPSAPAGLGNGQTTNRPVGSAWRPFGPYAMRLHALNLERQREELTQRERERERERREGDGDAGRPRRVPVPRPLPPYTGATLNQLRARPYVSQSSTHAQGHTHSNSLPSSLLSTPAGPEESVTDAQRRAARLGLIQMQRERAAATARGVLGSGGARSQAQPPSSSSVSRLRPLPTIPPRPRGFEAMSHRHSSPERLRQSILDRIAAEQADIRARVLSRRTDRSRERDREHGTSMLGSNSATGLADTTRDADSSADDIFRPTFDIYSYPGVMPRNEAVAERTSQEQSSLSRVAQASAAAIGTSGSRMFNQRSADMEDRRAMREPPREFLPIPPLPSPDLDLEFASTNVGWTASEDHIHISPHPGPTSVPMRRSPSQESVRPHRTTNWSPQRQLPPTNTLDFDPDSFAPGPFRNTMQSYWSRMNRDRRTSGGSQTAPTHQSQRRVSPPSLPPLAFEEDQRPLLAESDAFHRIYPSESAPHLRFLNRHHPSLNDPTRRPSNSEENTGSQPRYYDPGSLLRDFVSDDSNPSERNPLPRPPWIRDGDDALSGRPSHTYRPPWRTVNPPRIPPPDTQTSSDLHSFLMRHPRLEAARLESGLRSMPSRDNAVGFDHAFEALRRDALNNRLHERAGTNLRDGRPFITPSSAWGIMEDGQGNPHTRPSTTTNSGSNADPAPFHLSRRARRNLYIDLSDDETEPGLASNHPTYVPRRRVFGGDAPVFPRRVGAFARFGGGRFRGRPLGDYMASLRDEDFSDDYESLLLLAATLGDVKPRSTPEEVIAGLETGLYKDWKTPDSDHRCPICLDDYQPDDTLLKLTDCSHWLHRECLQQWLNSASTCPVCRKTVVGSSSSHTHPHAGPSNETSPSRRRDPPGAPGAGGSGSGGVGNSAGEGAPSGASRADIFRDPRMRRRFN